MCIGSTLAFIYVYTLVMTTQLLPKLGITFKHATNFNPDINIFGNEDNYLYIIEIKTCLKLWSNAKNNYTAESTNSYRYIWKVTCLKVFHNMIERLAQTIVGIWTKFVHNLRGCLYNIKGTTRWLELRHLEFHAIWSKGILKPFF